MQKRKRSNNFNFADPVQNEIVVALNGVGLVKSEDEVAKSGADLTKSDLNLAQSEINLTQRGINLVSSDFSLAKSESARANYVIDDVKSVIYREKSEDSRVIYGINRAKSVIYPVNFVVNCVKSFISVAFCCVDDTFYAISEVELTFLLQSLQKFFQLRRSFGDCESDGFVSQIQHADCNS